MFSPVLLHTEWSQGHAVGNLHQHLLLIAQENVRVLSECESNSTLRNAIYEKSVKENAEMICYQNGILESLKLTMKTLGDSLQETRHKIASLKHMVASERICSAELEKRSKHLENTKASIAVTTEAVKALTVPKTIGTYASDPLHPITFTINNFKKRIVTNDMWLSPPFYTHTGGYKMLILVYPNGYGNAQGKFVSVGLHLLSGVIETAFNLNGHQGPKPLSTYVCCKPPLWSDHYSEVSTVITYGDEMHVLYGSHLC